MTFGLSTDTLAMVAGIAAFIGLVSSPLMRSRSGILSVQLVVGIFFALHYVFLGVAAAAAVNVLGALQTSVAILAPRSRRLSMTGWALIPVMVAACIVFWSGPVALFSTAAMIAIAIGRMQKEELSLRLLLLVGGAFWLVHDFLVASWIAFYADLFCALIGLAVLVWRFWPQLAAVQFTRSHAAI